MMNAALAEKLKRLFALATLKPEEEGNQGRENEARNAAFLLLKCARDNGVAISFGEPGPSAQRVPIYGPNTSVSSAPIPSTPQRYKPPVVVNPSPMYRSKRNTWGEECCYCGLSLSSRIWVGVDGCTHVSR